MPIARGDCTVHNERVMHGSGGNDTAGFRRAYISPSARSDGRRPSASSASPTATTTRPRCSTTSASPARPAEPSPTARRRRRPARGRSTRHRSPSAPELTRSPHGRRSTAGRRQRRAGERPAPTGEPDDRSDLTDLTVLDPLAEAALGDASGSARWSGEPRTGVGRSGAPQRADRAVPGPAAARRRPADPPARPGGRRDPRRQRPRLPAVPVLRPPDVVRRRSDRRRSPTCSTCTS